jgi:4-diphosphocytidyl-2-C-methyl-D-erythritol kinase
VKQVRLVARAKINLFLEVLALREDGYHDIETVIQSIELSDEMTIRRSSLTEVVITLAEEVAGPIPESPDIVERAVGILNQMVGGTQAAEVRVLKRIPIASGLGGGSADAAAAIAGMNVLTGGQIPDETLMDICLQVGSDVPFALRGGTARATGRGEILEAIDSPQTLWWIVGIPPFSLRTSEVYRRFDELPPPGRRDSQKLVDALASGDVRGIGAPLHNDLEAPAFDLRPELLSLKESVLKAGVLGAVMSGSGPAIAGLCLEREHANEVAGRLSSHFHRVEVAASAPRGAEVIALDD